MLLRSPIILLTIFATSFLLFYIIQKLFIKFNFTDQINDRSSHSSIATLSGGITIFISVLLVSSFFYISKLEIFDFSLIVPLSLLVVVGLYDDIYNIDFRLKFIFQIIAAKILIDNGLIIDNLHGVLGIFELNRILAQLLTIFIIVAIINSINFIDGIDGLASAVVILFILSFEFFSVDVSPFFNLSLILIIAILPIFIFNFRKVNKIFLGDSGSLFLGGLVSTYVVYILSNNYIIKPEFDLHKIIFVFSILAYPIIDLIRITILRIFKGKSPFVADKNHIHHILIKKTNSHFVTTLLLLLGSLIFIIFIQILF